MTFSRTWLQRPVMPLTPFHLGPAFLLGVLLYRRLDLPTLLIGSVLVDVRAALVVLGPLDGPVHGILTTFVGGGGIAVLLTGAIRVLPRRLQAVLDRGRLHDTNALPPVLAASVVGVYSHVVLDSALYTEARPFFPFDWNPFLLGDAKSILIYGGCVAAGILGVGLYVARYREGGTATCA